MPTRPTHEDEGRACQLGDGPQHVPKWPKEHCFECSAFVGRDGVLGQWSGYEEPEWDEAYCGRHFRGHIWDMDAYYFEFHPGFPETTILANRAREESNPRYDGWLPPIESATALAAKERGA